MVMQIYTGEKIGTGYQANLGTTDGVYVAEGAFLGSTDTAAIYGAGLNHNIQIEGTVVGRNYGIFLDHSVPENSGQMIVIEETGKVYGGSTAIVAYAYDSYVENNGRITGTSGIYLKGDDHDGKSSTIINNGLIDTTYTAMFAYGTQDLYITNNGTIKTGAPIFDFSYSEGNMIFTNNGKIVGGINFGGGSGNTFVNNDIYDGARGTMSGLVNGGLGNDTFTGGKGVELFEGDAGRDILKGGGGADHFIFTDIADSTLAKKGRDLIADFSHKQHDIVDLSEIDARSSTPADNRFTFIGDHDFSDKQGELAFHIKGGSTFIQGDVDGDGVADFSIELHGKINLTAQDFVL
jgi:Ca2+-binding RTX toxin-like protein